MTWPVVFTSRAERDIRNLDRHVAARVVAAIERLAATGHGDVTHLTIPEHGADYHLKVGDWRVLFDRNAEPEKRLQHPSPGERRRPACRPLMFPLDVQAGRLRSQPFTRRPLPVAGHPL